MTEEEFKRCLPASVRGSVNDEIRQQLNACLADPNMREIVSQNLIGYTSVISQGKFKLSNYISAVMYVTYKTLGDTNIMAFKKTFPQRFSEMEATYKDMKDINSYISGYNKSKLVTLIYEAMMIPTHILNQDVFQEAINTQREIMSDKRVSPMVRVQAAKALMDALKQPEIKKMELDIGIKESDTISQLQKATEQLAQLQLQQLNKGTSLEDILNAPIIDVEPEDNNG